MSYLLLDRFRALFEGVKYRHRDSSLGDSVAVYLTEDLYVLNRSTKLNQRIDNGERVQNTQNLRRGIIARRGDGTFGELIPNATPIKVKGFHLFRGPIATVEIGVEVKIMFKAMIKQIDRVMGNMEDQIKHFQKGGSRPIAIAIVGINHANKCTSYEGSRAWPTDGKSTSILFKRPQQPKHESPPAFVRNTMNCCFCVSVLQTFALTTSSGSTKKKPRWTMARS